MAALCACLLWKTKACTVYSKHGEYHSSVMKDMCSNIECIFFSFFSASRKPKSRIDLLNEPGKDGLNKKKCEKVGNCRAKCCCQNTGGLPCDSDRTDFNVSNRNTPVLSCKGALRCAWVKSQLGLAVVPSGQAEGFDLCGGSVVNGAQNTEKILVITSY